MTDAFDKTRANFEAWMQTYYVEHGFISSKAEMQAAYTAGAKAEREACARLAEELESDNPQPSVFIHPLPSEIAAAIRARELVRP